MNTTGRQVCQSVPADRRQKLRIMFSADLVGSTDFKSRLVACLDDNYDEDAED
jgi:hypothetical protein